VTEYRVKSSVGADVGRKGSVSAVVATFGTKDLDGDVAYASTFTDGAEVVISSWNHSSMPVGGTLPVGMGRLRVTPSELIMDGKFFTQNRSGREAYEVVKELGARQEWSYGYRIEAQRPGSLNGEPVNILERVFVWEASPVGKAAGIGTRTLDIKTQQELLAIRRQVLSGAHGDGARAAAIVEHLRFIRNQLLIGAT
jgi:hypothetical protein